ncbi:hypothetical protein GL325_14685 [Aeromicrobium sp. 636]|uniref:Phosphotyrosine protein phosphatase I domain-containing protein n=1 Tax=Aeromicrobium senzhongii TaxID=2663859 RepID=A0A8I0K0Z3_9ACTN|nr:MULTISPECIES: hypothetical protein [Aeromicrobium]MBC9227572.1 hypothetical protein [Aeromicrobium senzhongii]MCQ3999669.1 hypothetical protein [Aeromicrobium sp. 636]
MPEFDREAHVLLVCRANVCRSALGEFVATERLATAGISVSSAGTDAVAGEKLCHHVETSISGTAGGADFAAGHRATPLREAWLHRADLILTTSPRESSLVALSQPTLRNRTFTLIEVERLLSQLPATGSSPATLAELVQTLHRRRWRAANENWPGHHWTREHLDRRRPATGLALRDAHVGSSTSHPRLMPFTRRLVTDVCDEIAARMGTRPGPGGAPQPVIRPAPEPSDVRS